MFLQLMKCNLTSQFNNLPLNSRVKFHSVTVKCKIPQALQIKQKPRLQPICTASQTASVEPCQLGTDEKLAPYRDHQICVFCFYFLTLTSNPVTTSEAELLANSNFFFFLFLFHSRNMCQVQTVKFICCCSSPPHTILAEGEISNAITPKPPRKVAQDALMFWEGAEDNEEAKLAKAGTLLKYFVGQGAQLQCPWCGR